MIAVAASLSVFASALLVLWLGVSVRSEAGIETPRAGAWV